jgi:hypothetical protein
MKKLATIILIALFIWSLCSAYAANATTLQGGVQTTIRNSRIENGNLSSNTLQSGTADGDNLSPPLNATIDNSKFHSGTAFQQTVKPPYLLHSKHDTKLYGVFGGMINCHTGQVMSIYPGSHVAEAGISKGDCILYINGRHFTWPVMLTECQGQPGTLIDIEYLHNGIGYRTTVTRVDARIVSGTELNSDMNRGYYERLAAKEQN